MCVCVLWQAGSGHWVEARAGSGHWVEAQADKLGFPLFQHSLFTICLFDAFIVIPLVKPTPSALEIDAANVLKHPEMPTLHKEKQTGENVGEA